MLSPSDFNNAVPQFTNGDYASNPINPQYIAEPDAENYNRGTEPLQTLPAQWWNWFLNRFTNRFNKVNIYVKNIFNELAQLLSLVSETPSGTEGTPTVGQLKDMFETKYPDYLKTTPALSNTYVPKTTRVNGHELTGNITITCVACASCNGSGTAFGTAATKNTGTAAGCIPIVGTALGTTNNNILVTDSTGKLKPSGITVGTAAGCDATLFARKTEIDALYGNVCGCPVSGHVGSVGSCTTFARSDHVHPVPLCFGSFNDNWYVFANYNKCSDCRFYLDASSTCNNTSRLGVRVECADYAAEAGYACCAARADPLIHTSAICVCLCCISSLGGTCQYNVYVCSRCSYPAKPMGGYGSIYGCCYAYILSTGTYFYSGSFICIGCVSGSNLQSYCMPGMLVKY